MMIMMMVVMVVILCTGNSLIKTQVEALKDATERGDAALVSLGLEWCVL